MFCCYVVLFFIDTATPECYTYCPIAALRDALPFSVSSVREPRRMSIQVALHHRTSYSYDRLISLGPQTVRLRPAPHSRTPVLSYSLRIEPKDHFINRSEEHTSELQSLMRISYAVFCLKKNTTTPTDENIDAQ